MKFRSGGGELRNSHSLSGDFFPIITNPPSTDMNDWITAGFYTAFNPSNSPESNWIECFVFCANNDPSHPRQICFGHWGSIFYRFNNSDYWRPWAQLH